MGLPTVSIGGLGSGLDSNAIINALSQLKQRPITLMEQRKSLISAQRAAMNTLRTDMKALQTVAQKFKEASAFSAFTADSADKSILTAKVDGSAQAGTYLINVGQLAQQQIDVASGIADTDTTTLGTGTISFTVDGEEVELTLDSENNTLTELASDINKLDIGLTATIVNDGSANPYNLVITADESGEDNAITYDFTGYTAGDIDLSTELTTEQAALNAELTLNGISISSSSNLVSEAITGVTINLLDAHSDSGESARLTVSTDVDAIVEDVREFVDAYNKVQGFIDSQFDYDTEGGAGGVLFGDFTVSSVRSQLQQVVTSAVDNDNTFGSLGAIGILTSSDGTLSIDESDLKDAIEDNPDQVIDLFVEGGGGILEDLDSTIQEFTKVAGIFDLREDGFDVTIKDLNGQIDRAEDRLATYQTNLNRRFARLESVMAGLQSQLAFLQSSV